MLTQSLRHRKSTSEADLLTDLRALQMLVRSVQLVQVLMNRPKNLETMSNHSQLERNVLKRLEKESVPANTLLKEQKL